MGEIGKSNSKSIGKVWAIVSLGGLGRGLESLAVVGSGGLGRGLESLVVVGLGGLGRGSESLVVELEGSGVSNPLNLIDSYIVSESSSVSNRMDIVEVLGGN